MAEIPEEVRRAVWKRDKYRCRECGVAVAQKRGCMPQTHHITPEAAGGSTDMENLATLCYVCHALKPSIGHQQLFIRAANDPNLLPQFIKWAVWDSATNLAGYAEWINPRDFPAEQVVKELEQWRMSLDRAIQWTREVLDAHPSCVCDAPQKFEGAAEPEQFEGVKAGIANAWYSHVAQQFFDEHVTRAAGR